MSAARWSGVPVSAVLARAGIRPQATRVRVSGFDEHSRPSRNSRPGASWTFTFDTWTLWWHAWRPSSPGTHQIVLRVDDPAVRTRRLDLFFYTREVSIDEV